MSAGSIVASSVNPIYDKLPRPLVLPIFLLTPALLGAAGAFAYGRVRHRPLTATQYATSAVVGLVGAIASMEVYAAILGSNPPDPGGALDTALYIVGPVGGVAAGAATAALLAK